MSEGKNNLAVRLGDDGTLDTVLHWECKVCGDTGTERFSEVDRSTEGDILPEEWARLVEECEESHAQQSEGCYDDSPV